MTPRKERPDSPATARHQGTPGQLAPPRATLPAWYFLVPLYALLAATVLLATLTPTGVVDTWISLAGGRHVLAHGVDDVDPFSYLSRPPTAAARAVTWWSTLDPTGWINQNWLSHVFLTWIVGLWGLDALILWKALNYVLVALVLVTTARVRGASTSLALLCSSGALLASRELLSIRAQDLTNLLLTLLYLVLALAARRNARWIWAVVPIMAMWANAHGGYVFGLVTLVVFAGWQLLVAGPGRRLGERSLLRPPQVVAAVALAFLCTVALSPYRLANAIHVVAITLAADAARWRTIAEWQPLLSTAGGYAVAPFLIFTGVALVALLFSLTRVRWLPGRDPRASSPGAVAQPTLREIEPWGALMALLAVAMAFSSARFLSIAALVTAPFAAAWLHISLQAAGLGPAPQRAPAPPAVRPKLAIAVAVALWAATLAQIPPLARAASHVIAGPWPHSTSRTSPFHRLTGSHRFPWEACSFLTENRVTGRIFNTWGDGGFLAWCQRPSPETGEILVKILIDGRAQAAYDGTVYQLYHAIGHGGPLEELAVAGTRQPTAGEWAAALSWFQGVLHEHGVWLALLPSTNEVTFASQALFNTSGWEVAYLDEHYAIVANVGHPQGRALCDRVSSGTAVFPTELSSLLTRAYRGLRREDVAGPRPSFELATRTLDQSPSRRALRLMIQAASTPELKRQLVERCELIARDFVAGQERFRREHGYGARLELALEALGYLSRSGDERAAQRGSWVAEQLLLVRDEWQRVLAATSW